jgi:uncharacterized protein (UPF0333 family)
MNKKFIQKKSLSLKVLNKEGSALLMAILILSSIIAVSFSVSRMVMTAIETGGVQAQSVIAYYSAESGAERILYGIRHGSIVIDENNPNLFSGFSTLDNGAVYTVSVKQYNPLKIISVGSFNTTKRSVELSF